MMHTYQGDLKVLLATKGSFGQAFRPSILSSILRYVRTGLKVN